MDLKTLEIGCKRYKDLEGRASFYEKALIIAKKYPLQASIILLATWNTARFRFMSSNAKNLLELEKSLNQCKSLFDKLSNYDIKNVDLDEIKPTIERIYTSLSKVKGVEYTGGSKVMSLINPKLFVMWDDKIRQHYKINRKDAEAYIKFLFLMQNEVKDINWNNKTKTLAKAIDEYNYINFTWSELKNRKNRSNHS